MVADAAKEERSAFIRRTYAHVAGAIAAFGGVEVLLLFVLPFVLLSEAELSKEIIDQVPRKVILRYKFVPLSFEKGIMEAASEGASDAGGVCNNYGDKWV